MNQKRWDRVKRLWAGEPRRLSAQEIADEMGCSPSTVSRALRGVSDPKPWRLQEIVEAAARVLAKPGRPKFRTYRGRKPQSSDPAAGRNPKQTHQLAARSQRARRPAAED